MGAIPESARAVLESDGLAHLVTVNPDGSPQVTIFWVGLEGDEIVSAHLREQQKLRNVRRDARVALSIETPNDAATTEVQFSAPVISKRQATTQIFLKDGQTTVIGGLAGNNTSKTVSGIPILSRIPLIGGLFFGNTSQVSTTNELFLFLTPHIISSDEDIDRLRNAVKRGSDLLHDVNVGPRINPNVDSIPLDSLKKLDSLRRDSLTLLRRRPPEDSSSRVEGPPYAEESTTPPPGSSAPAGTA